MSKQPMGSGFRFQKIMGWAPAIVIMFGVLLTALGSLYAGVSVAMAGVVFGILVKRRARRGASTVASSA
jgi:hypothetical protein